MPDDATNPYWNQGCITAPSTYTFDRMGQSTVSYGGQSARLLMAIELYNSFSTGSEAQLLEMFNDGTGFGSVDFNGTTIDLSTWEEAAR